MYQTNARRLAPLFSLKTAIISLIVAAAVTIPAMGGTLADFTAVTTNPGNAFQTAVLTMTTDSPASAFVTVGDLIPGDSATRIVTVSNSGSVPFTYTISASNSGGPASLLWTDGVDGLQVEVSGDAGVLYSGALKNMSATGATVAAGGTEVLTYVISLPNSAGNAFQGLSQGFDITYDATQLV